MAETISADGSSINFESAGRGPVLVVVGGAFNTRHSPGGLVPLLTDRLTVVTFDRRGRGDSTDASASTPGEGGFPLPDTSDHPGAIAREVADVRAVVDAVGGRAMLYGHSSGAALALAAAAGTTAITRVVGYEPPYSTEGPRGAESGGMTQTVLRALAAADRDAAARAFLAGTGADVDAMAGQPWWPGLVALANTLPYDLALTDDGPPSATLARIEAPVLLLVGGDSAPWARDAAAEAARSIPQVSTRVLPGQTHNVADNALSPVLLEFLLGA